MGGEFFGDDALLGGLVLFGVFIWGGGVVGVLTTRSVVEISVSTTNLLIMRICDNVLVLWGGGVFTIATG